MFQLNFIMSSDYLDNSTYELNCTQRALFCIEKNS